MKILFVHNYYEYAGGEDIAVREEIDLLKRKGHRVEALFFDNKTIKKGSFYEGVKAIYSHSTKKDIESKIRSFAPDIIHVHNLFFVVSPSIFFVAQKFKIPVLVTLHNYRLICCKALLLRDGEVCELCTNKKMPIAGIKYKCYRSSYLQSALVTAITSIHKFIGTWKNRVTHYIALTEFAKNRFLDSSLEINLNQVDVIPNFLEDQRLEVVPRENFYLLCSKPVDVVVVVDVTSVVNPFDFPSMRLLDLMVFLNNTNPIAVVAEPNNIPSKFP